MTGEVEQHPGKLVILIAEEPICRKAIRAAYSTESFTNAYSVETLESNPGERPAYGLGVATRSDGDWHAVLKLAMDREVFGASLGETARLYGALVSTAILQHGGYFVEAMGLTDFDEATNEFQEIVCREVVDHLMSLMPRDADGRQSEALVRYARMTAYDTAKSTLPEAWLASLRRITCRFEAVNVDPRAEGSQYCRSCSVSLMEEANRGASDRYCCFCSDEQGRLKPRGEVQRLIAEWLQHWQGGVSEDEAMRRAHLFMQAMPAWCDN
jgi:hypothetical protein